MLLLLAALGCQSDPAKPRVRPDRAPADTSVDSSPGVDADGDGVTMEGGDCDDSNADIYPGRTEGCDGVDDDCDGRTDEGWPDTDGDRVADCMDVEDCDEIDNDGDGATDEDFDADGDGWTTCRHDCDDANPEIHPRAQEVCDDANTDEDCDGFADDEDEDAEGGGPAHPDADGDGYGSDADATWRCDAPAGSLSTGGDCDDDDPAVSEGAEEVCGNGLDDDCDGSAGDCGLGGEQSLGESDASFLGESAEDLAGWGVAGLGDLDGDGHDDLLVSAPGNDDGAVDAGATYILYGPQSGEVDLADATARLLGVAEDDVAGYSAGSAGDWDGDGTPDVFVGAYGADSIAGAVYVLTEIVAGDTTLDAAAVTLAGEVAGDEAGYDVVAIDDVDGDGKGELAVGATGESEGVFRGGAVYLVAGGSSGDVSLAGATTKFLGESSNDSVGRGVASPGDVDGDGIDDLLIGTCGEDSGGVEAGATYLVLLPQSGTVNLADAEAKVTAASGFDRACVPAWVGDMDGDGAGDVAIGAHGAAGSDGAVYLFFSVPAGPVSATAADAQIEGAEFWDALGCSLAGAGDIDGDGGDDLVVGGDGDGANLSSTSGSAYLFLGPVPTGSILASDADAWLTGESANDEAGHAVAAAGDTDGDGFADVLVGAPYEGASDAGAAYLVLGGDGWW